MGKSLVVAVMVTKRRNAVDVSCKCLSARHHVLCAPAEPLTLATSRSAAAAAPAALWHHRCLWLPLRCPIPGRSIFSTGRGWCQELAGAWRWSSAWGSRPVWCGGAFTPTVAAGWWRYLSHSVSCTKLKGLASWLAISQGRTGLGGWVND